MNQRLSTIHTLRTDRQTDGRSKDRRQYGAIDAYSIAVIKEARQKLCTVGYRPTNQC